MPASTSKSVAPAAQSKHQFWQNASWQKGGKLLDKAENSCRSKIWKEI